MYIYVQIHTQQAAKLQVISRETEETGRCFGVRAKNAPKRNPTSIRKLQKLTAKKVQDFHRYSVCEREREREAERERQKERERGESADLVKWDRERSCRFIRSCRFRSATATRASQCLKFKFLLLLPSFCFLLRACGVGVWCRCHASRIANYFFFKKKASTFLLVASRKKDDCHASRKNKFAFSMNVLDSLLRSHASV